MNTSTASEPLFADTWGWLVLANDRDPAFDAGIRHVLTGDAHFSQVGLGFHQLPQD